jgi:hypothetical protein
MSVLMFSFIVLGTVCTAATLALLAYRIRLTYHEDTSIHVNFAETSLTDHQVTVAHQLQWIDRVGPLLTVLVVVYALVLTFIYVYVPWAAARLAA